MADLFDYLLWRGDLDFVQSPFNKIDALLLAQISYSKVDGLLSDSFNHAKTLSQLSKDIKSASDYKERLNVGVLINNRVTELLDKCSKTNRFKDMKVCGYRSIFNQEDAEQFSGFCFLYGKKWEQKAVVLKGTDDTLVGWHEDFDLSWKEEIPSQRDSLKYFADVCHHFKSGKITLIGHSKGGNLVVNTAAKCGEKLQRRIADVYNFDGPGFSAAFFESDDFMRVETKIHSYFPSFSLVGVVFSHQKNFTIVQSSASAAWQHDMLTWNILGIDFETAKDFTKESKAFCRNLNAWLEKLSVEQKRNFVDAMFSMADATGASSLTQLKNDNKIAVSGKILSVVTSMDKETRSEVFKIISLLTDVIRTDIFNSFGAILSVKK